MEVKNVPIKDICMSSDFNCRGSLPPIEVMDLAKDLEKRGQIQPVVAMKYDTPKDGYTYLLLIGYRRTTAAKIIGWDSISAIIKPEMGEVEARYMNLRENVQRQDLTIIQEANALKKLKELGVSREMAASHLTKSSGWVQVRYMVLDFPEDIQQEFVASKINQTQIRELNSILKRKGIDETYEALKGIKKARERGNKQVTVNPNRDVPDKKIHRRRPEIFGMIDEVADRIGFGAATRCLAWCAGEITTEELYDSLEDK